MKLLLGMTEITYRYSEADHLSGRYATRSLLFSSRYGLAFSGWSAFLGFLPLATYNPPHTVTDLTFPPCYFTSAHQVPLCSAACGFFHSRMIEFEAKLKTRPSRVVHCLYEWISYNSLVEIGEATFATYDKCLGLWCENKTDCPCI